MSVASGQVFSADRMMCGYQCGELQRAGNAALRAVEAPPRLSATIAGHRIAQDEGGNRIHDFALGSQEGVEGPG